MVKLLRKYNKWILVIGGSLLMVAFLLGQTLQQLGQGAGGGTALTVAGEDVSVVEFQQATREVDALRPISVARGILGGLGVMDETGKADSTHWVLLTEAAHRAGLTGNAADAEPLVPALAREFSQEIFVREVRAGNQAPDFAKIAAQGEEMARASLPGSLGTRTLGDALAELRGVQRLAATYYQTPARSEARLINEGRRLADSAVVSAILIPVSEADAAAVTVDDATVQAQYQKHRDVLAGSGEFGFGYRFPDRVKLRWLTLDPAAIGPALRPDPVEVARRARTLTTEPDPAKRRAQAEAAVRAEKTKDVVEELRQAIKGELLKSVATLGEQGRYRQVPANFTPADLAAVAQAATGRVREATGVELPPGTIKVDQTDWITPAEAGSLPVVGAAKLRVGQQDLDLPDLLQSLREFEPAAPRLPLQAGVPLTEPLRVPAADAQTGQRDPEKAVYLLVAAAEKSRPPTGLDEVRGQVLADARRLAAYERLTARGAELVNLAFEHPPEQLVDVIKVSHPDAAPTEPITLSRGRGAQPEVAGVTTEAFVDAVMARASALDPTKPFDDSNLGQRTLVVPVPAKQAVALVRIVEYRPLTLELYRSQIAQLAEGLRSREVDASFKEAFSVPALAKRLDVQGLREDAAE